MRSSSLPTTIHSPRESGSDMKGYDVLIVGAGIIGSACALECVRAGLRVAAFRRVARLPQAWAMWW
jgi:NADPH-dependent 2,4-dienoyl-CoA reductase/sulfur reductase-like enzyme